MNLACPLDIALPAVAEAYDACADVMRVSQSQWKGQAGGRLMAVFGLDPQGIASVVAGCVAGAAVLAVDADRERAKQMLRFGICDFVVNDLDEALRILKNEVRKKQPVSVCMAADLEACAQQMVERGLQPDLLAGAMEGAAAVLQERGAAVLGADQDAPAGQRVLWRFRSAGAFVPLHVLTQVDHLAADALDPRMAETPMRRLWLERAPRYLGRKLAAERSVRMHPEELERFQAALAEDVALAAQIEVRAEA
ncbi:MULTISPECIES: hypothetical protein [Acidobacterium]|nr:MULTISPECIES: hypothetical protein [Acidobacterium]HCT61748.1 hypothetical protein [Acidobacterium sp.]